MAPVRGLCANLGGLGWVSHLAGKGRGCGRGLRLWQAEIGINKAGLFGGVLQKPLIGEAMGARPKRAGGFGEVFHTVEQVDIVPEKHPVPLAPCGVH